MKSFLLLLVFSSSVLTGKSQNLVGLHKDEVKKVIKESYKKFRPDKMTVNKAYNYMKYVDYLDEQTMICFLSDQDYCISVQLISDYIHLNEVIKSLNSEYKRQSDTKWTFTDKGKKYIVTLRKDEWFFVVFTKPLK